MSFTGAELLVNDVDPQGQLLAVVAVSEPRSMVCCPGLAAGFVYTPGDDAAFVGTDQSIDYLVIDPDGHVTEQTIVIRILAAGDPNRRRWLVRTWRDTVRGRRCMSRWNDFDPDGDGFWVVGCPIRRTGGSTFGARYS